MGRNSLLLDLSDKAPDMKCSIMFAAIVLLATSAIADQIQDLASCTAGSALGDALAAAMSGCPASAADEADKIGALDPSVCTPFDQVKDAMTYEGASEICILQNMGWMRDDSIAMLTTPGGAPHMTDDMVASCMENFHNKFAKFDPADSCYASYTIAQQGWLDSASDDALMIDCLMYLQGCGIEKWDKNTLQ